MHVDLIKLYDQYCKDSAVKLTLHLYVSEAKTLQQAVPHINGSGGPLPVAMPPLPPGGMPQLPPGGMPQLPPGGMPQLPPGGMPQLPPGGMPQLPPRRESNCSSEGRQSRRDQHFKKHQSASSSDSSSERENVKKQKYTVKSDKSKGCTSRSVINLEINLGAMKPTYCSIIILIKLF